MNVVCHGRRVFGTKNGHIGLGPPDLQTGDLICSFIGAEVLFVLRENDRQLRGNRVGTISQPLAKNAKTGWRRLCIWTDVWRGFQGIGPWI